MMSVPDTEPPRRLLGCGNSVPPLPIGQDGQPFPGPRPGAAAVSEDLAGRESVGGHPDLTFSCGRDAPHVS